MKTLLTICLVLLSGLSGFSQVSLIVSNGTSVNQSTYIATSYAGGGSFSVQASGTLSPGQTLVWNYGGFSGGASAWFNAGSNGVNVVAGVWTLGVPYTNIYTITPAIAGTVQLSVTNQMTTNVVTWIAVSTDGVTYTHYWDGVLFPGYSVSLTTNLFNGGTTAYFGVGSNGVNQVVSSWTAGNAYTNSYVFVPYHPPFWRVDFIVTNNTATPQATYIATSYAGGASFFTQWSGTLAVGAWTNWIYDGFTGGGNAAWFNAGSNGVNVVAAVFNLGTGSTNVFYLGGIPPPPTVPGIAHYVYFKERDKYGHEKIIILRGIKLR